MRRSCVDGRCELTLDALHSAEGKGLGSAVGVTGPGKHSEKNRWDCHGCGDSSDRPEEDYLFRIRPDANNHAATCRAIPLR